MDRNELLKAMADLPAGESFEQDQAWWEKYLSDDVRGWDTREQFLEIATSRIFDEIVALLSPTVYVLWGNYHQREAHSSVHSIYTEDGLPAMLNVIRTMREGTYTSLAIYQQRLDDPKGMRLWLFSADPKTGTITTWNPKQEAEVKRVWKLMDPSGAIEQEAHS